MSRQAKSPRQGEIYFINPKSVVLKCKDGHRSRSDISGLDQVNCSHLHCSLTINSSRIMRGEHPHIVWSKFDESLLTSLYYVIPLTSQNTFDGLSTTYPINPNQENGLDKGSRALIHQFITVDAACFKDRNGDWIERIGKITRTQKKDIKEILGNLLNLLSDPNDDWFMRNTSPELIEKIFNYIEPSEKEKLIERLIYKIEPKE